MTTNPPRPRLGTKSILPALLLISSVLTTPAWSQTTPAGISEQNQTKPDDGTLPQEAADQIPAALKKSYESGSKINYLGQIGSHLTAWQLTRKDDSGKVISKPVVTTSDGQFLIAGPVWDHNGNNITKEQVSRLLIRIAELKNHIPTSGPLEFNNDGTVRTGSTSDFHQNQPTSPTTDLNSLPQAQPQQRPTSTTAHQTDEQKQTTKKLTDFTANIVVGQDNLPNIFLFTSPTCASCISTWQKLKPYIDAGRIKITIVPIPTTESEIITESAIIRKQSPDQEWNFYETSQALSNSPLANRYSDADVRKGLQINKQVLDSIRQNLTSLPLIVYVSNDGIINTIDADHLDPEQILPKIPSP